MTARSISPLRSRVAKLGGALAIGTALLWSPASAFADDAAPAAAPAAAATTAAAPAVAPKPTDVVATVGDQSITEGDLAYATEDLG